MTEKPMWFITYEFRVRFEDADGHSRFSWGSWSKHASIGEEDPATWLLENRRVGSRVSQSDGSTRCEEYMVLFACQIPRSERLECVYKGNVGELWDVD